MGVCFSLGILNVKQLSLLFIVLPLLCSLYHRTLPNFRFVNACSLDICVSYGECALGRSAKGTMYNHVHVGYSVCDAVDGSQYCVAADRHFHLVLHQGSTGGGEWDCLTAGVTSCDVMVRDAPAKAHHCAKQWTTVCCLSCYSCCVWSGRINLLRIATCTAPREYERFMNIFVNCVWLLSRGHLIKPIRNCVFFCSKLRAVCCIQFIEWFCYLPRQSPRVVRLVYWSRLVYQTKTG